MSKSLLTFPCEFPIKAFAHNREGSGDLIAAIVRRHVPGLGEDAFSNRPSKGGKFIAMTVTIQAHSQAQLDAIYRDLSACPEVLMSL
ncbi:MAG: DUF493 domain-containing protein [Methylococcaceae bacterium]|nr:DUF493 domain-containing protein [Methylococcaceae bacterium]